MKIIRNGVEFELTKEELFEAYVEQEHIWDVDYVFNMLPDFEEYDSIPKNKREDVIEKVATAMRAFVLKNDCNDYEALEYVIENNTNLFN